MSALLFLLNAVCYAGQSATGKYYAARGGQAQSFNLSKSFSAALLFFIWIIIGRKGIHLRTLPYALLYGICLAVSMHAGFMALSQGPMALTSIMAAMSLLIPSLWGLIFWQEQLSLLSGIGILLLTISIVFINYKKQGTVSKKWLIYSLITMLTNGFCSVIQKYHQTAFPGQYQVDFMLFAMAMVSLLVVCKTLTKKRPAIRLSLLGSCSGILNGLANFIILLLAASQSASTLFPLISAGNVMTAWVSGILFFREKTQKMQLFGLLAGIIGIVLMNL